MQLDLPFSSASEVRAANSREFRLPEKQRRGVEPAKPGDRVEFVRVRRARRYILRVRPDGSLRVTIPRGGSRAEAMAFLQRHGSWVARERDRVRRERAPVVWTHGSTILLDGIQHTIRIEYRGARLVACYAGRTVQVQSAADVRAELEQDLCALAKERLAPRLLHLADHHGLQVRRVTIRNQRSRWGSCSQSGAIALNFRLVQMPPEVCDYVLIHELMHLRQQNHGRRFWALVARACPGFREAERWLRREGRALF